MNYHHRHVWPVIRKSVRKTLRRPLRVLEWPHGSHHDHDHTRNRRQRYPSPTHIGTADPSSAPIAMQTANNNAHVDGSMRLSQQV